MRLEGSGPAKLAQAIRKIGYNEYDRFELATVTSVAPLTIKVDNVPLTLDAADIVLCERLADRTVKLRAADGTVTEYTALSPLEAGDRVIVASMNNGQHYVVLDRLAR